MATPNDVMEGMKIIFRHSDNSEITGHNFQAEHDQIWCGEYNADKMSEGEINSMDDLGWFESEGSWSKYT
jgi:hypothetical protein